MLPLPALPLWALKYWQPIAGFAAGATLAGLIGWGALAIQSASHDRAMADAAREADEKLTAVSAGLIAKCQKDKQLNMEVSREYETRLAARDDQLKRLRAKAANSSCVPVSASKPASRVDGAAAAAEHGGAHGLDPLTLADYSGDSEQYRAQTVGLQDFVCRTWAENGQPLPAGCPAAPAPPPPAAWWQFWR